MSVLAIFEVFFKIGLPVIGWFLNFGKSKKDKKEWVAKASETIHKKGWVRSKFVLEMEADRSKYLDEVLAKEEARLLKQEPEPERPQAESLAAIRLPSYHIPKIVEVEVEVQTHGKYLTHSGRARGLVAHYTAGHWLSDEDPVKTLRRLAKRGLGCMVMGYDGTIYKAKNQAWDEVAYHAGESSWRGKKAISRHCMGMEICSAGKLTADQNGAWHPWWHFDPKTKKLKPGKKSIGSNRLRHVKEDTANIKAGTYHQFSEAQEKALTNFCLWQLDVNPEFMVKFCIGHDECAPGRKTDPGASLSMTMPDFRAKLDRLRR